MTSETSQSSCAHAELARDFQPFDVADPFGFYARARAQAPIFYSPELDYWVLTRYEDMRDIFRDPATFSSENTQAPYRPRPAQVQRILDDGGFAIASGLSGRQPPDHTRLRGFIKQAFTPRRVAELEPEIRAIVTTMIDAFIDAGHCDLVAQLAYELPALVIFRMLGIPDADVPNVKEWARSRILMNFGDTSPQEQCEHAHNLVRYWSYCRELVASRVEEPRDDLPGALVEILRRGEEAITADEIAGLVYGQLTAGHETTTALLSSGLKLLLEQRDAWDALCADPALIPNGVEELLRLSTPVFAWKRRTTRAANVAGVALEPGTNLLMLLGSANHDETVFADPERIDLERENASRHLAFGLGIHFCVGAPLARLEARVVIEELSARLPQLSLVEDQSFDYPANSSFRGPTRVLVQWPTAAPAVLRFERCAQAGPELLGGKGASLAALSTAGLPVPPGFIVTTAAFDAVRAGAGVPTEALLAALDDVPADRLGALGGALRAELEQVALPATLAASIAERYRELCGAGEEAAVAVRSSATGEDSAEASFAGQQDTHLWVIGEAAVLDAVRRCWASLYSERSIAYRRDRGIDEEGLSIAVVVQRMVDAESSGVAMTIDPLSGERTRIVVEASFGLGELVVSGEVTPDHFVLDKVLLETVEQRIGAKEIELVADPGGRGVSRRSVDPARRLLPALDPAQLRAVAGLAKRAERHHGCPQDVEWAIDRGGEVWLLQSRPETVHSRTAPAPDATFASGLESIAQTLINPLAARRGADVDD